MEERNQVKEGVIIAYKIVGHLVDFFNLRFFKYKYIKSNKRK